VRAPEADLALAQDDLKSLSIEILERYEEASLIYRLTERLAETVEARRSPPSSCARSRPSWAPARARSGSARTGRPRWRPLSRGPAPSPRTSRRRWRCSPTAAPGSGNRAPAASRCCPSPLTARTGASLGAIVLRGRAGGRGYGSVELKLLASLGTLASAFIRNGELLAEVRRADARRRDDAIAREVHQGLLPKADPTIPGLDLAGGCLAAGNVGGDYYGWLPDLPGSTGLVVADVSGHGVGAALVMAAAKGALRAEWRASRSPSALLAGANALLVQELSDADLFVTAFVARLDGPAPGRLQRRPSSRASSSRPRGRGDARLRRSRAGRGRGRALRRAGDRARTRGRAGGLHGRPRGDPRSGRVFLRQRRGGGRGAERAQRFPPPPFAAGSWRPPPPTVPGPPCRTTSPSWWRG
jgi:hypothetical protein